MKILNKAEKLIKIDLIEDTSQSRPGIAKANDFTLLGEISSFKEERIITNNEEWIIMNDNE